MLARVMQVVGVDPRKMDDRLAHFPSFRFIQKPAVALTGPELTDINPDWLVTDMNIAPLEALDEIGYLVKLLRRAHGRNLKLKSGFFTIKLNDWRFADSIPLYLKRIEETGFTNLIPIQLSTNRQEFFVYADGFEN